MNGPWRSQRLAVRPLLARSGDLGGHGLVVRHLRVDAYLGLTAATVGT